MGFLSEAYVFAIIGLGMMQFAMTWWAPYFIILLFPVLFFARLVSTLLIQYLFVLFGARHALKAEEVYFFAF